MTARDRLIQRHRVRRMIDKVIGATQKLLGIYEEEADKEKATCLIINKEQEMMAGGGGVFVEFYDRLKEIRRNMRLDQHVMTTRRADHEDEELIDHDDQRSICRRLIFSGEEAFGRYLDMHELYNEYINTKFGDPYIGYSAFLDAFPQIHVNTPSGQKLRRQYRDYLQRVLDYLTSFFERTEPLQDLGRILSEVEAEFEEQEQYCGSHHGYKVRRLHGGRRQQQCCCYSAVALDLDGYTCVEELIAAAGPEKLKEALAARGLKTGGTVEQRAQRLFRTKGYSIGSAAADPLMIPRKINSHKEISLTEAKLQRMCQLLGQTITRTKEYVERKQGLTCKEMEAERKEDDDYPTDTADIDGNEDQQQAAAAANYNPLNLPLGCDGKPIPYWLYKLHGLDKEFSCEICGNHTYRGRRAFECHFREWRHQYGMRCLNIPNTNCFNEITSIHEAKQLWKKIQEQHRLRSWCPDLEEEYEDSHGNVYNKRTYADLQRQGLLS